MIKIATLASLCVLVSQVHAAAPPLNIVNNECLYARKIGNPAKPTVQDEHFDDDPNAVPHLKANASKVTCVQNMEKGFFERLGADRARDVFSYLYDANTIQHVKEDILKNLSEGTCATFQARSFAGKMTTKQIAALPNDCFSITNIGQMSPAQIKAIDLKATGKHASEFLGIQRFCKHMTDKQLKAAGGNDYTQCSDLSLADLAEVNKDTLAKLDRRCLQATTGWGAADEALAKKLLPKINPEALNEIGINRIPDAILPSLTPSLLKVLDKKNTDDQCRGVNLRYLNPVDAGEISKTCFLHALNSMAEGDVREINPAFFLLASKDIFVDIKDTDLIKKADEVPKIWSHLQKEHYAAIIKLGTEVCEYIKFGNGERRFTYAADLEADCFAKMSEATQRWILNHYGVIVKEDILSKVDGSRREFGTAYLEDVIKDLAIARPQLIKHFGIGEASNSENVCSTYDILKLKDPKELKRAGRYLPVNCLKSMQLVAPNDAIQFTELSLYPKALVDLLDMAVVIENLSDDSLRNMDEAKWKAFIGPATCGALNHEKFKNVGHDIAFPHITASCLDELKFLEELEANEIRSIPPKVLGSVKAATIGKLDVSHFEVEQVKVLGANASGLGADAFIKFEKDQIGALSAVAISSLPIGAFSALKADKWQHIAPESLTSIKYEQLNAVPEDILLQTTEQQAAKIPHDAAKAFDKCRDRLPSQVANALPQSSAKKEEPAAK